MLTTTIKTQKKIKLNRLFIVTILFLLGTIKTFATTWDEPWADKIIKEADYFVFADIVSFDDETGIKI